jgi:hypothetical protein
MKRIIAFFAALPLSIGLLSAQDSVGIPNDVFYLMPKMTQGTLLFRDKSPVNGKFNICAVDNTVRFMDKGKELAMEDDESMLEVVFHDVAFLHRDGTFYRLYPVSDEAFVAVKRDVLIMNDSKIASYGMESNTTAVQNIDTFNMPGRTLDLSDMKNIPYRMSETAALYRKGSIISLSKRNLTKCFPDKKADIEAWFDANKKLDPTNIPAVLELCKQWSGK